MKVIHVDVAATRLKEIVTAALNGEAVYLYADDPQRAVRLLPGDMGDMMWMADDFDAPLSEFKSYSYPDPVIRPYAAEDHKKVVDLLLELQAFERTLDTSLKPGDSVRYAALVDGFLDHCRSHQGMIYVAEMDNRVVGLVHVYREQVDKDHTELYDYLYIADIIVTQSYRGQGVATALLAQVETHARQIGTPLIKLYVLTNNSAAINLYRRFGFRFDEVVMVKQLR